MPYKYQWDIPMGLHRQQTVVQRIATNDFNSNFYLVSISNSKFYLIVIFVCFASHRLKQGTR